MRNRPRPSDLVLLACLLGLLMLPYLVAPPGATFEGTDAVATTLLQDTGVQPWMGPLLPPGDATRETVLFAMQGGLGALALGYALARLRGRAAQANSAPAGEPPTDPADGRAA